MEYIVKLDILLLSLVLICFFMLSVLFIWFVFKVLQIFSVYLCLSHCGSDAKWCGGPNTWAVISGATDGIGLAYAKAMAEKGYSLVLMSRSASKLSEVKENILSSYVNCYQIRTIAVDFTKPDIYDYIEDELKSLDKIHVLINNVGITNKYPEYFTEMPDRNQFISDVINVNIFAMTRLMSIVLPKMVDQKSGIILNISSYSALFPTPFLAVYSATKIYEDYLSRALSAEYSPQGIIIQSVLPYYVSTNMIKNPRVSFMIPSTDRFVKSALKTVGLETRTFGYFPHALFAFLQNFLVKFFLTEELNIKFAFWKLKRLRDGCHARRSSYQKRIKVMNNNRSIV